MLPDEEIILFGLMDEFGHEFQHQFLVRSLRLSDGWDWLELGNFFFHETIIQLKL